MSLHDIILSRRTIRQFRPDPVPPDIFPELVNAARLAPSGGNLQPLEFIAVGEAAQRKRIFPCLKWAGYIAPEGNPKPGQEPSAYVVILVNTSVRAKGFEYDVGAAMENMILTAHARGLGSCWIWSCDKDALREILGVPEKYLVDSVLALGYPAEHPIIEKHSGSVEYWKDGSGTLHVPKRSLEDLIHYERF